MLPWNTTIVLAWFGLAFLFFPLLDCMYIHTYVDTYILCRIAESPQLIASNAETADLFMVVVGD